MATSSPNVTDECDVLVIGGGAVGVCSAYFLSESGRSVTLVDQDDICAGSSYGNAGLAVPSHSIPLASPGVLRQGLKWMLNPESPFYIKPRLDLDLFSWLWQFRAACTERHRDRATPFICEVSLKSLELFEAFAAMDDMDFAYQKRGGLHLFKTQKGLQKGIHEAEFLRGIGLEAQILGPAEVQERLGGVRTTVSGGVFYPEDAHMVPAEFVRALAGKVVSMGGRVLPSAKVVGFATQGRVITGVRTTRGELRASEVVLAAGSWTPGIARGLGLKVPIQPAKGYSVTYRRPEGFPDVPFVCGEAKMAVTPMRDTVRYAGTLELAGMDLSINHRRVAAVVRAPGAYLPDLDSAKMEQIEVWAGLRPCTPDGLPLLGRVPAYDNLTIAAGHAMIGVSTSPASGKLVAQIVTGQPTFVDISLLHPGRFG